MAYSESLAQRLRQAFSQRRGIVEKKMFGGIAFLLYGNLCVGIWKTALIVRLDPARYAEMLALPDVREFDVTGRPMKGWVLVEPNGIETDEQLQTWIQRSLDFVTTLPRK